MVGQRQSLKRSVAQSLEPRRSTQPQGSHSAVILCSSAALGEAVSRALHPLPTRVCRVDSQVELNLPPMRPKLVLIIELVGNAALEAIRVAKNHWPSSRALVVGISNDEDMILACVDAGADGILESREGFSELAAAVETVAEGHFRVPGSTVRRIFDRLLKVEHSEAHSSGRRRLVRLSIREKEVLAWIAQGLSNKEIADRLGIAERTVKNHVGHVLQKLGVHSRFDAVRLTAPKEPAGS